MVWKVSVLLLASCGGVKRALTRAGTRFIRVGQPPGRVTTVVTTSVNEITVAVLVTTVVTTFVA